MGRHARAMGLGLLGCSLLMGCAGRTGCAALQQPQALTVQVHDDSERIGRKARGLSFGESNESAVWNEKEGVKLFGLPGETVAFQVVVRAGKQTLHDVKVEVVVQGEEPQKVPRIEKYVVLDLPMARRSGGKHEGESLGWSARATPQDPSQQGSLADPLVPVGYAPKTSDYPMTIERQESRSVWVDVEIGEDVKAGSKGYILIQGKSETGDGVLSRIAFELEVGAKVLPYAAIKTMVYFDPRELIGRIGSEQAVRQYQQVMHAHHVSTFGPITTVGELESQRSALTGELYGGKEGYRGPGKGVAADVVVLGSYGRLGEPSGEKLSEVSKILEQLAKDGIEDSPGRVDIFLYAIDEQCASPRAEEWKKALRESDDARLRKLRVGQTCSEEPSKQAADIVMIAAEALEEGATRAARESKKALWVYNGWEPKTGSFLTDATGLGLRANGWLQQAYGIERWFYWESTFWNDNNRGGKGPYDPYAQAETFHNQHGDYANGDGVLVYPGRQQVNGWTNLQYAGVFPSIRLKQWRRGIQDAGYIQLAATIDSAETRKVVERIVPPFSTIGEPRGAPAWSTKGRAYHDARRRLFDIIARAKD